MYKPLSFLLFLAAALPLAASAAPHYRLYTVEQAVEMRDFGVRLDAEHRAELSARPCDQCAPVTLRIDESTVLRERGGPVLPLETLNGAPLQAATLFYLPESGRVTRITLQR